MNQEKYNYIDTLIKILGAVALIISGVFGFIQYKDIQEREYKKPFYEKQIEVVDELFEVLGDIDKVPSSEEKIKAAANFWIIYHGKSRTFLDSKMVRALEMPADYVAACINKVRKPKIVSSCENFSASMSAVGFAKVAREQLSLGWKMSFDEIGRTDPWAYIPD
ncbi:hypothetical protein C3Y98_04330 [Methylotenera oryzisoli]|uniref:Uncharacterized protein n=1 Tax=Methylotenera oryzisoli TaxID=2080758 RepID=A0A4Y9VTJ3_9PROT|nr:hypothetical protein [Methylotenera oryzisoli]TFW72338.1 hypothetical protein C3Y98_04330 [Methylotenera oryzisoli]